jgi:chromosome segregation ATPase
MSVKHRDKAIANLRNALSEKDRELRKTKGKLKRNLDSTSMGLYNEIDRLTTKLVIAESQCRDLANDYDELRIAMTNAEAEMLQYMEREGSWETEDEAESPSSSETSQMPAN